MKSFGEFVDKKTREAKRQLGIVQKILQLEGIRTSGNLSDTDPFVYVEDPTKRLSFGGVRIYKIGNAISFRITIF